MKTSSSIDKLIKRQVKLTILSVIAVVLITSTITYALYQTNHENTTDQVISIGNLGLTATGTSITLEGLYPMEEYDLTSSYPSYNFTLENKTNGVNNDYTLMYELILRAEENTTLTQDDYQYIMYKIDGSESKPLSEVWDSEINGFKVLDGRLISNAEATDTLAGKDKENHSIVFWLSTYAPNNVQGKVLTLKMSLEAYADRFNYLKYYAYADNNVFGKTLNRSDFESITTLDTIEIPESAIESWDVSNKQNKSIIAWYTDIDNNGLYELYIGQFGGVIANPNCGFIFREYSQVTIINVTNFNTELSTNFYGFFYTNPNNNKLRQINGLNILNVKSVTTMAAMFRGISNILSLDLSAWDTSCITNINSMFQYCHVLRDIILGNDWNTTHVTDMSYTFYNCTLLLNIDYSKFDTSNVTNMAGIFCFESNVSRDINLDLSTWNTSNVTNVTYMFANRKGNITINLSNMTFDNVTSYSNMFKNIIDTSTTIVVNECAEDFIKARLAEAGRSNVTLEIVPCIKVCYSYNINSLPSEYTKLEYIESTGTQYIDTNYINTSSTDYEISFTPTELFKSAQQYYAGDKISLYIPKLMSSASNLTSLSLETSSAKSITIDTINKNIIKVIGTTYEVNGTLYTGLNRSNGSGTLTWWLFNSHGEPTLFSAMRLYYLRLYENRTPVRNYIPALRKSDNTIGLYETVEGRFYENSGTGVFEYGNLTLEANNVCDNSKTFIGEQITIVNSMFARANYHFVGWNTKPDGTGTIFKQGEVVDASVLKSLGDDAITLYAMWEENQSE